MFHGQRDSLLAGEKPGCLDRVFDFSAVHVGLGQGFDVLFLDVAAVSRRAVTLRPGKGLPDEHLGVEVELWIVDRQVDAGLEGGVEGGDPVRC